MKKLKLALLTAFTALTLAVPAFADIVPEPEPTGNNVPLIAVIILVAAVAVVLAAFYLKKRRASK